jgi:hypothetical protein
MSIFSLINNKLDILPENLSIPEFKAVWDDDSTKDKSIAKQELAYIYFTCDFNSIYKNYPMDKQESYIIKDHIKMKNWVPGPLVRKAMDRYNDLQQTPNMRFLTSAQMAAESLIEYFEDIDWNALDGMGKPKYKVTEVTGSLEKAGKILQSLEALKEKVQKEMNITDNKLRGGGKLGRYEA